MAASMMADLRYEMLYQDAIYFQKIITNPLVFLKMVYKIVDPNIKVNPLSRVSLCVKGLSLHIK